MVWGLARKEPARQCRRLGFNSWIRTIPGRSGWQPTAVFWPGESHRQRSLVGCSPGGRRELDIPEHARAHVSFPTRLSVHGVCRQSGKIPSAGPSRDNPICGRSLLGKRGYRQAEGGVGRLRWRVPSCLTRPASVRADHRWLPSEPSPGASSSEKVLGGA